MQGVASVAEEVLQAPAPDVPELVIYKYFADRREPTAAPGYARASKVYGADVSLAHADFSAPPAADLAALKALGPTPHHRRSFAPVKSFF